MELALLGVTLGDTYPYPIVDHSFARERAPRHVRRSSPPRAAVDNESDPPPFKECGAHKSLARFGGSESGAQPAICRSTYCRMPPWR